MKKPRNRTADNAPISGRGLPEHQLAEVRGGGIIGGGITANTNGVVHTNN